MAQIPLLNTRAKKRAEPGHVPARTLEERNWQGCAVVFEVVVGAELLRTTRRNIVIEANCKLVGIYHLRRRCCKSSRPERRHVLLVNCLCHWIETLGGNLVIRK